MHPSPSRGRSVAKRWRVISPIVAALVAAVAVSAPGSAGAAGTASAPPCVVHRGLYGADIDPDTLPAFTKAESSGYSGSELDLRSSTDQRPVIEHNSTLRSVGHPEMSVETEDWSTLSTLVHRHGAPLARLGDVTGGTSGRLLVEVKHSAYQPGFWTARRDELIAQGALSRTWFYAPRELAHRINTEAPELTVLIKLSDGIIPAADVKRVDGVDGVLGAGQTMTKVYLDALHRRGLLGVSHGVVSGVDMVYVNDPTKCAAVK